MKKRILQTAIVLGVTLLVAGVSTLSTGNQHLVFYSNLFQKNIDMLIFVSPQYAADAEIETVIASYCKAVNDDLSWNTKVISITEAENDFRKIDQIIETFYGLYDIKACIMVGEDFDTALSGDYGYMEKPSTVPWFTTGGESGYGVSEQRVVCQPYVMDICISLIYPTHDLYYQTKKSQILSVFDKFCEQRGGYYFDDVLVFESSAVDTYSKEVYHKMGTYGTLFYGEDPNDGELSASLDRSYSMYYVHGHSNPSGTDLNTGEGGWFSAALIDEVKTPFFGADGCYVGGWWSDQLDNNMLDPSIDCLWYGSTIFTSTHVQVMALGLLSQNGFSYPVSFIENVVPGLAEGETLAESMILHTYLGETIIVGDPTFHYTIY